MCAMCASRRIGFALLAATVCVLLSGAWFATAHAAKPPVVNQVAPAKLRLREGTQMVDRAGSIRVSGQRYVFHSAPDGSEFRLLENLALERVIRTQDELREDRPWTVSGVVTEFQGENFLLLTRAVAKSSPPSTSAARTGRPGAP